MGPTPSGGTQHLLNGAALTHMQASHKWVGGIMVGLESRFDVSSNKM